MATIQDVIITISISAIMVMFILSTFGSYSPTISGITEPHLAQLNSTRADIDIIKDELSGSSQELEVSPDPLSALASALGGIAVLTLTVGKLLLSTLITVPLAFIGLVFSLLLGGTTALAPDYQPVVMLMQDLTLVIIPVVIILGIVFRIILSRPPEL